MSPLDQVLERLTHTRKIGSGWEARCPAHEDRNPSLSVRLGDTGSVVLKCHAGCVTEDVVAALGMTMTDLFPPKEPRRIVDTYDYTDENGTLLSQVVRFDPKDFRNRRPGGPGEEQWIWKLADTRRVLYRLPEVLAEPGHVYIVEGEKDADALAEVGLMATTNLGGAGKWRDSYADSLTHVQKVTVVADRDQAGRDHARRVAASLAGKVSTFDVVQPPEGFKDVSEMLAAGLKREAFEPLPDESSDDVPEDRDARVQEELERLRVRDRARRLFDAETRPPLPDPEVLSLRDRIARGHDELEWRIEGWQPTGTRVILAAQFKAGKTTLVGNLGRSLVDGVLFLGTAEVTPVIGRLTVLDFEMSPRQLDGWLAAQGIENDDRVVPIPLRGRAASFDILNDQVRAAWARRLAGTEYLIIDPLRPILDALGLDEWRDAGKFLTPLDHLLTEAGIPDALVVHHMGHSGERSRGDSRLRDWPDVEWRLVREDDDPASTRYISAYGRDVDVPESRLDYDEPTRHLTVSGGSRSDAKVDAALADIYQLLAVEPGLSGREIERRIMASCGHSLHTVRKAVKKGVDQRRIITDPGPHGARLHRLASQGAEDTHDPVALLQSELGAEELPDPFEGGRG